MKFYLETNSIRTLSKELISFKNDCFTSVLSIIELISGINNNEQFHLRKKIISNLISSNLTIDYELPQKKFLKSFGLSVNMDFETDYKELIFILQKSNSYKTFLIQLERNNSIAFSFSVEYDWRMGNELNSAFEGRTKEFNQEYGIKDGQQQSNERWNNFSINKIKEYTVHPIQKHASSLESQSLLNPDKLTREELIVNYDGSIDVALLIGFLYAETKVLYEGSSIGKNDNFDINHVFYLKNLDSIMVTDDKLLHKLFNRILPSNIISAKKFHRVYST